MKFVPEELRKAAALYEERNKLYGSIYLEQGRLMEALFLNGIELKTTKDKTRFSTLVQMINKISRYCIQFNSGGHDDSLIDLSVYCMMLREIDRENENEESRLT